MNKKIIISLSVIAVVAAVVVGGTIAYFSDTETSTGNTFTAGTIDISVNGENPWSESFTLADMKPCYTDYINFRIENDLSDPNPVNIFKKITVTNEGTGVVSEPECDDQGGLWDKSTKACDWNTTSATDNNDLSSMIWYDLNVEVYNSLEQKIWWQTLYVDGDNKSIDDVYGTDSV
ncbi:MAG: TasA family protein, partial [Candidatus Heimdallarchaeaceae archaeon]